MRRGTACALLLAIATLGVAFAGCGSDTSKQDAAAAAHRRALAAAHARSLATGRAVFEKHCHSCHTLGGKHFTGPVIEFVAPNLDEVRLERRYVESRVETGGPSMASFSGELSRAQFRGVVEYVTETAGRNVPDAAPSSADLAAGKQVFEGHCAVCHALAGRAPTGNPPYPATDFNIVKPAPAWVIRRLHEGVLPGPGGMMPTFRGKLTDAQMRAVATYVSAVARAGPQAPAGG